MSTQIGGFAPLTHPEFKPISRYVGSPLQEMEATRQNLEDRYMTNKANQDKLEIGITNLKNSVHEFDRPYLDEALQTAKKQLEYIKQNGNWADADLQVQQAAKDFATNTKVSTVVNDYKAAQAAYAKLIERVNDKDEMLPQKYADWLWQDANKNFKGTQFDANGNVIKSSRFNVGNVGRYINLTDYYNKIGEGWKANGIVDETGRTATWTDKGYIWSDNGEQVAETELREAFRKIAETNPAISSQLAFEMHHEMKDAIDKIDEASGAYIRDVNGDIRFSGVDIDTDIPGGFKDLLKYNGKSVENGRIKTIDVNGTLVETKADKELNDYLYDVTGNMTPEGAEFIDKKYKQLRYENKINESIDPMVQKYAFSKSKYDPTKDWLSEFRMTQEVKKLEAETDDTEVDLFDNLPQTVQTYHEDFPNLHEAVKEGGLPLYEAFKAEIQSLQTEIEKEQTILDKAKIETEDIFGNKTTENKVSKELITASENKIEALKNKKQDLEQFYKGKDILELNTLNELGITEEKQKFLKDNYGINKPLTSFSEQELKQQIIENGLKDGLITQKDIDDGSALYDIIKKRNPNNNNDASFQWNKDRRELVAMLSPKKEVMAAKLDEEGLKKFITNPVDVTTKKTISKKLNAAAEKYFAENYSQMNFTNADGEKVKISLGKDDKAIYAGTTTVPVNGHYQNKYIVTKLVKGKDGESDYYAEPQIVYTKASPEFLLKRLEETYKKDPVAGEALQNEMAAGILSKAQRYKSYDLDKAFGTQGNFGTLQFRDTEGNPNIAGLNYVIKLPNGQIEDIGGIEDNINVLGAYIRLRAGVTDYKDATQVEQDVKNNISSITAIPTSLYEPLTQIIKFETGGYNPKWLHTDNGTGHMGLIQFGKEDIDDINANFGTQIKHENISNMNVKQQLQLTNYYLQLPHIKGKIKTKEDLYLAVFAPALLDAQRNGQGIRNQSPVAILGQETWDKYKAANPAFANVQTIEDITKIVFK